MTNEARFARWISASHSLGGLTEPYAAVVVQGLGRIDLQILPIDDFFAAPLCEAHKTLEASDLLTQYMTLSHLWVLGTYEVVRVACQRAREGDLVSQATLDRILAYKRRVERLRVPLAKMEPARKHKATDYVFPLGAMQQTRGIAWAVAPGEVISRRELSDGFLDAFENLPHSRRGTPVPEESGP